MENTNIVDIDVRKIMRIVLEHWWWFIVGGLVFGVIGILYYMRTTPTWETEGTISLRQNDVIGSQFDALSILGLGNSSVTDDEVVVLSSRGLLHQAIDALNLWDANSVKGGMRWTGEFRNPALKIDFAGLNADGRMCRVIVQVKPTKSGYKVYTKMPPFRRSTTKVEELGTPIETCAGTLVVHATRELSRDTVYRVVHAPREEVVDGYRSRITMEQYKRESNIIELSTVSTMPERDKALLYQIIEQYNLNSIVDKNLIATNTASFIEERLAVIASELSDAENAVATYKEQYHIADLSAQAQLVLEANNEDRRALAEIETQLNLTEYIDGFLRDETKRNNLIPSNIGVTDASLAGALSEYNALQLQRLRILRTATDDNPVIEQMNDQLSSMRANIIASIGSVRESLKIRQHNLQLQDSKFNRELRSAPEKEREYLRVMRQQQIKEQLYIYLYQKREENALMLSATSMPAKIVDMPQCDITSKSPRLLKVLMVCLVLGLGFPAALLFFYTVFYDKIDDAKEMERRIKAPLLGQLVQNSRNAHIAIHEGESTVSAELFRLIRTNLRFVLPKDVKSPVILVTSCINGDGKSYVSSNLALSLAMLGKNVVLVGLDIRKPMLATYFGLNTKGHLTDYLAEPDLTLDDIIVPSGEHKNLDLVPCGTIPPNPAELLQTDRVEELFAELRKRYDYVIVDTAPVALVSDTYLLDRVADMSVFVCRFKYTPSEMIDYINQIVEQKRMHNVVCVLNGVKGLRAGYGYGGQQE